MSHNIKEYDSSGPRPPIPGEETVKSIKMIDTFMTSSSSSSSSNNTPPCLQWARTLSNLLEDREGAELFKTYVELEGGIHKERLNFYFACEGLKQESDPEKTKKIIGLIYSKILKKSDLHVPNDVKQLVKAGLKDEVAISSRIYDQMQKDVKRIIQETTYPNFLQSDIYLDYVQQATQGSTLAAPVISENFQQVITTSITGTTNIISETSSKFLLSRSSTLPTLMEEGDASSLTDQLSDLAEGAVGFSNEPMSRMPLSVSSTKIPLSLTKDALMATQRRRLEMRSPGNHSAYNINNYAPYNPVSRRDSELASLSSGRTDSDTMSISSMSTDGRPHQRRHYHHHHHPSSALEKKMIRENAYIDNETQFVIPRTQRVDAKSQNLPMEEFLKILVPKLEAVKKEQDRMELLSKKLLEVEQSKSNKLFVDAISAKLMLDDDKDDQDILDQHVSRVWADRTPHRSPGNMSPGNQLNQQFQRRKPFDVHIAGGSIQSSIRISKSMPESNIRKFTKWGSVNTDSGISLFSSDTMTIKQKDAISISSASCSGSSASKVPRGTLNIPAQEPLSISGVQKQVEDVRRSKRYQHQPPLPLKSPSIPPPIPAKNLQQQPQQSLSPLPQTIQHQLPLEHTTVVYSFCDEDVPYRIKIPGNGLITLKQFKDFIPKKGNYRFFFKTRCEDEELVIQEEITQDSEVLPLFDGKVVANIKPVN